MAPVTRLLAVAPGALLAACWMGADLEHGGGGDGGTDFESDLGTDTYPLPQAADGGIFDPFTNLVWQDPPASGLMNQYNARDYCEELVHGGEDDWYLPDVTRLRGLLRDCGSGCPVHDPACLSGTCGSPPACHGCGYLEGPDAGGCYWPGWLAGWCHKYWSCSPLSIAYNTFWLVDFRSGGFMFMDQMWTAAVRCVRDPQ